MAYQTGAYDPTSPTGLSASFAPSPAKSRQAVRPNRYFGIRKRLFDILMVLVAIPVVLPLVVVLWAMVRTDRGPGFYSQLRVGRDGRAFRCWKLRTMTPDAEDHLRRLCKADPAIAREWAENQKLAKDPRITRFGHFLRRSSLDELPQLWNILRGEMSFVGPRPFLPEQQALYTEAGGEAYFLMRPGVTGEWQVRGRSATRFVDRVRFDEAYYDNASLTQDLRLMAETVLVVARMTGR